MVANKMEEKPVDNGNTWLGLSAGTGAWGGMTYLVAGHFCPACLILTPLLFIGGIVKKMRYRNSAIKPLTPAKAVIKPSQFSG